MSISDQFLGDGPIPGASFTEEVGTAPWQKPPRITSPTEAFTEFLRVLDTDNNYDMLVFCMEEGLPIEGLASTIVNNMVAGGTITYDVALLMTPEVSRVIKAIGDNAEVDYVERIPRQVDTELVEMQLERIKRGKGKEPEPEPEEKEEEEKEPEDKEKPKRKGLMGA